MASRTLGVWIACDPKKVYELVSNLEHLPRWATTFCRSIARNGSEWVLQTPQGPMRMRIALPNSWGVVDHYVIPSPGVEVYVPMRIVPHLGGSEVLFTLFRQPNMTDASYAEDARLVEQDLQSLKRLLEAGHPTR